MDRVEITNVGTLQGVASEATLQQLLLITKKGKGDSKKVQELYNKSLNRSIRTQKNLNDEVSKTEKAFDVLSKTVRTSNARLSEFIEGIVGNNNMLTRSLNRLTYFVDENIDRWRALSQVGAGFENNLSEIIKTSTASNMSLSEFTDVVMDNSELLRSFGSTVTQGSIEFGSLSRELRRGFGRDLMSMGFTFEEVNEVLLSYMEINRRMIRSDQMSQREILEGTQAYAMELERLTRLTGMSRKQAQEAMQAQMRDQRVRMVMSNMTSEEQARFQANLARANSEADGFGEILTQLAAGDPGDEFTRLVRTFAPALVDQAADLQNMSASEMQNFIVTFREDLQAVSDNLGSDVISVLGRRNPLFGQLFQLTANLSHVNSLTAEEAEQMEAELAARNLVTQAFGNFSEIVRQVTSTFRGLFLGLDEFGNELNNEEGFWGALNSLGESIRRMFSPSGGTRSVTNIMDSFMGRMRQIVQLFIGPTGFLTRGIKRAQDFLESERFQELFSSVADTFNREVSRISDIIDNMFDGEVGILDGLKQIVFGDTDPKTATVSLWETFKNFVGLNNDSERLSLWDRFKNFVGLDDRLSQGRTLIESITNWFRDLMFGEVVDNTRPDGTGEDIREGGLVSVIKDLVGMQGNESIGGFIRRTIEEISNRFTSLLDSTTATLRGLIGMGSDESFGDWVKRMLGTGGRSIGEWFTGLIESTLETIEDSLRGMLGMGENETFSEYLVRMAGEMTQAALAAVSSFIRNQMSRLDPVSRESRQSARDLSEATKQQGGIPGMMYRIPGMETVTGLGMDFGQQLRQRLPGRIVGTLQATGQPTEPRDTVAQIHQGERVLNPQETREFNSQSDIQRDMIKKLDELNTSMHTMVNLMTQELAVQSRTMNSIRGLGPDLMKGIPR